MPKVSIIVPVYGVVQYLERCVRSLVAQRLADVEVILVDDGAIDGSGELCDTLARTDPRLRVVHRPNGGLGRARNSGLEVATGDYVAFVDADDYVDEAMYEALWNAARTKDADAVFCGFAIETARGMAPRTEVPAEQCWEGQAVTAFLLDMIASAPGVAEERRYWMSVWHAIYRRSVAGDLRFCSERDVLSEDIPFQVDFLRRARRVVYLPAAYYRYCLNGASLTSTFRLSKFEAMKRLHAVLLQKTEGLTGAAVRVDRLLVGYVRTYLLQLAAAGVPDERKHLAAVTADDVWTGLRRRYPARWLPFYPRLVYSLILARRNGLLAVVLHAVVGLKRLAGQRL